MHVKTVMAEPVRIVLVDDHELFRSGLAKMLTDRGIDVVGTAASGEAALAIAARAHPDVVLMDLSLPGMSGIEATSRLADSYPEIAVVVLTVMTDESDLIDAILAGASGYLLKDASLDEIIAGVESAARGESIIAPQLTGKLLRRIRSGRGEIGAPRPQLTEREREVLALMIEGRDNAAIAARLYISQSTVKHHVAAILDKLGVDNRVQAAVRAVRGWMT
jgi:DNA-binding NarL/FixJ family response regulator